MIFCYILLKSRLFKIKLVKDKAKVFKYQGLQYKIDPEAVYDRKLLGLKRVKTVLYVEGNESPLRFCDDGRIDYKEMPLDEVAFVMNKIKMGIFGELGFVFTIINFIMLLILIVGLINSGVLVI